MPCRLPMEIRREYSAEYDHCARKYKGADCATADRFEKCCGKENVSAVCRRNSITKLDRIFTELQVVLHICDSVFDINIDLFYR